MSCNGSGWLVFESDEPDADGLPVVRCPECGLPFAGWFPIPSHEPRTAPHIAEGAGWWHRLPLAGQALLALAPLVAILLIPVVVRWAA